MSDNGGVFENEAQQEEDKFEDSSEEEEDEDNFEEDDFIVDDVGGDAEDAPPPRPLRSDDDDDDLAERKKKRKKKRRRYDDSHELAEGDLELLEEKGVRIDRKKKLRRLRKGASDEEDNVGLDDDVRDLADIEDDDLYERRRQPEEPVDYDDDMDDFIDDGGRRRRRRAAERDGLVSSEAVRQARSIFGDVEEMTQYRGVDKLFQKGQDGDDDDDADYVGDGEEREEQRPLRTIRERDTDRFGEIDEVPAEPTQTQDETIAMQLSGPTDDTEEAKRIIAMDVPEQLQYHFGPNHRTPTDAQLKEEGAWIYNHGFRDNPMFQDYEHYKPDAVTNRIVVVLSYIHIDKLDIPFIAMYRKDYITPFLIPRAGEVLRGNPTEQDFETRGAMRTPRGFNSYKYEDYRPGVAVDHLRGVPRGYDDGFGDWSVLWHILDLDKKYASMLKKRQELLAAAKDAADKGVPPLVVEDVTNIVQTCEEEQRLKDAENYLHLAVELAEVVSKGNNALSDYLDDDDDEKRAKRPSRRKNRYADFCKRGYRALTEEFGLSARQFGENFRGFSEYGSGMQMHVPLDADDEPLEVARVCADRLGESADRIGITGQKLAERLLSAARLILVTEIVADMQVIQTAREILCKAGTVSITTIPTRQGIAQVDDTHPLRPVTCLVEKQLESFTNTTDFALIMRAVNLGFTELQVVLQPEQLALFDGLLHTSFLVSGVTSLMVEKWNEERMLVVEEVKKILTKQLLEEVTDELTNHTHSVLRSRLSQAASRRFMLGPGRPNPSDDGCPRVLAVCVTGEEDEEPDPHQVAKDAETAKGKGKMSSDKRVARERLTFVELDESGEYQTGYEVFAGWLRRPVRHDMPDSKLPEPIKDQLKAFISQSRAQVITIGIGSGGRSVMRLHTDLIDIITEMMCGNTDVDDRRTPLLLSLREVDEIQKLNTEKESRELAGNWREAEEPLKAIRHILSQYVVLVDEFPARIYARIEAASVGLSVDAMTLLEKRAIALGRLGQEPLWIYSAIGQEREAALHFKMHPYHYFAEPKDRLIALQRALFRAVCANGVDINRMLRLPHTHSMLAFVGGLGMHKSKALLRALESSLSEEDRGLPSRKHLWSENYLGRIVFLSTAAFLRVRDPELHPGGSTRRAVDFRRARLSRKSRGRRRDDDGSAVFDPMDDSRIHPEHYAVAIKIADEALRDDDGNLRVDIPESDEHSEALRMTSAVLDDATGLQRLALDEYADHLEKLGRGSLFETVKIIASEFQGPYKDYRQALCSPDPQAVFYLVTGADPIMLRVGSVVAATNCRLREKRRPDPDQRNIFGVTCSLPHNVRGYIPLFPQSQFTDDDHLSDDELRRLLPDGCSWRCRILEFKHDRFEAILTSRGSAIDNPDNIPGYVPLVNRQDPAYRPYPILDPQEPNGSRMLPLKSAEKTQAPANPVLKRTTKNLRQNAKPVVHHPYFREVTGEDVISLFKNALPGDIIIRPSQYDRDGIIFSCKFATLPDMDTDTKPRGVFHKDCQMEYDRDDNMIPLRLKLDDVIYEHVDQVLEQYLRPIISNLAECLEHRKFKSGSIRELEKFVSEEKKRAPNSIPYRFGLSEKNLTSLTLVFVPGSTTVEQEEIKVVPDGFRLRNVLHKNMNVLFTWFKKNMRRSVRRPAAGKDPVGASPFQSAYTSVASPYRAVASPYRGASPFVAPRSPFVAPSSPFVAPSSPFVGAQIRPAQDAPPPPAPLPTSNLPDPYRAVQQEPISRAPYPNTNAPNPISADEWAKATLQRDEPPPSSAQNGNYGGAPPPRSPPPRSPPRRFDDMRGNGRGPPPQGPPPRGPPPPGPPPRGPPPRGPPPRRPPPRRPPGGGEGNMPEWRGAKPVPAWKKAQEQQGEQ